MLPHFLKSKNSKWIAKNDAGDKRLRRIYNILDFYGFLTFSDRWEFGIKTVIVISLLVVSYTRDLVYFVQKIANRDFSIPADMELLTFMQTESITALRIFIFITKRREIAKLLRQVVEEFPPWLEGDGVKEMAFKKCIGKGMGIYWFHVFQLVSVGTLLVLRPLASGKAYTLMSTPPLNSLPYLPNDRAPYYHITYLFQAWEKPMEIAIAFCINMMFFTMVIRVSAHIKCIGMALENVGSRKDAARVLSLFVRNHCKIKRFVDDFNKTFRISTAIQPVYTAVSVITSLLVFDGTKESISFAGIALAHMLEHFIYCYAGNLIAEKSSQLGDKLYQTCWYEMGIRDKKTALQIIQNSSRPIHIKAGMFGVFSRAMFTTTMKTTYSVWAVVSQAR